MDRGARVASTLALLCACAGSPAPAPAPEPAEAATDLGIALDPRTRELDPEAMQAWLAYGFARIAAIRSGGAAHSGGALDDYAIELAARRGMVEFWEEQSRASQASDPYLDALRAVEEAGHLEEYVVLAFGRPGWTLPGEALAALDFTGFHDFARQHLAQHQVQTLVRVTGAGAPAFPAIPGDALPEVAELTPDARVCARLGELRAAFGEWRREEAALEAVALAASEPAELGAILERLASSPELRRRGARWVSPKAARIGFLVGFCEVDRRDYAAAVEPLEAAVRVHPLVPMWRLELATALTMVKRFEDAEREIAAAIDSTEDACILGAAWRRRGYLLIDRGLLWEAHEAYATSLQHDPGNPIATQEIELIVREIEGAGGALPPDYVPPGRGEQTVRRCPGH